VFNKGFEIANVAHLSSDQYDDYLKSVLTYNEAKAVTDTAYADGKLEGKIEGVQEKALEVAKTMLAKGFDSSLIAEITQLSITAIEDLRI
jgi:predicted transposase/invertase (TIGR01784 family)